MTSYLLELLLLFAGQVLSLPGQSFSYKDYTNSQITGSDDGFERLSDSRNGAVMAPRSKKTESLTETEFNRALMYAFVNKTIATEIRATKNHQRGDVQKENVFADVDEKHMNEDKKDVVMHGENKNVTIDDNTNGEEEEDDAMDDHEDHDDPNIKSEVDCGTDLSLLRNGLGAGNFLWPGGNIPYFIDENFNQTFRANIKQAVDYYNSVLSGCINWKERTDEQNYVIFKYEQSCSSKIGMAFWPFPLPQPIFLGKCAHLVGHIKHEMMHTVGFYHEHSRSDRDMYIKILWQNIPTAYQSQFATHRWTTAYGEKYDYKSIMHYSSRAFVKDRNNPDMKTIIPLDDTVPSDALGWKRDLSETDIAKIKKMYKCSPYDTWKISCSNDGDCGINEYCSSYISGECRTQLPNGSMCVSDAECVHYCGQGICSSCSSSSHCPSSQYCSYTYLPVVENQCQDYCNALCLYGGNCGGDCGKCSWLFTCQK